MPITISLSPNTQPDDVREAWNVLLNPKLWHAPDIIPAIEQQLAQHLKGRSVVLVSSGRRALYEALTAAGIQQGDEVILQAFTCSVVPAAIQWTRATPVYADIDPTTYNLTAQTVQQKITQKTKALIVQHTFGIPAPLEELRTLATEHNLLLIEDCAHALGGTYNNQPLGTFGELAIFSFGRDKTLSCVFGGAVASNNETYIASIRQKQEKLTQPPAHWIIQQLLHPILMSYIIPVYFAAGIGKVALVALQKAKTLSKAVEPQEKKGGQPPHYTYTFSPALGHLLQQQIEKLSRYTKRRQEIAQRYQQAFEHDPAITLPQALGVPSWLRFPIQVAEAEQLRRAARTAGMLLGDWYTTPIAPADTTMNTLGYQQGTCPVAEKTAQRVLNLPTNPTLTNAEIEKVISWIKENVSTNPNNSQP